MLPLGLRVQEKLEGLVDKHMRSLGMWLFWVPIISKSDHL